MIVVKACTCDAMEPGEEGEGAFKENNLAWKRETAVYTCVQAQ